MKFNNKIEELLGSGKISPEQAQALRRSLGDEGALAIDSGYHKTLPSGIIWGAVTAIVILFVIWGSSGTHQPQTVQNVAATLNQAGGIGEMNKSMTSILSILLFAIPVLVWFIFSYNGLVSKEENVLTAWAQVESNYQRRLDLIPNLVKTVKAYTEHEGSTLTNITQLRAQAEALQTNGQKAEQLSQGSVGKLNDESYMKSLASAQDKVSNTLKSIMVQVEAYPNLKASDQFLELQGQIEGTENRINVARMAFNESVNNFNGAIRRVPGSLLAGLGNFHRKAYFKSDEGADKTVKIDF